MSAIQLQRYATALEQIQQQRDEAIVEVLLAGETKAEVMRRTGLTNLRVNRIQKGARLIRVGAGRAVRYVRALDEH